MGTSRPTYLQEYGNFIIRLNPKNVLDIGVGFGKNGYLAREYTDIRNYRVSPETWTTKIDGIEIFEKYIHAASKFIYNNIYIGDVFSHVDKFLDYDFVVMTDVLEHFNKEDAVKLMGIISKSKHFFVTTPIKPSAQKTVNGNIHEAHLCKFTLKELSKYGRVVAKPNHNIFLAYK